MGVRLSATFWTGCGLGALLLWLALREVDFGQLRLALAQARLTWAMPLLALLVAFYSLKAVRWGLLLRPLAHIPHGLLFRAIMIGYASNALLPAQMGDLVRGVVTSREMRLQLAPVLTTLVVERVLDLLIVVLFLAVAALLLPQLPPPLHRLGVPVVVICSAALLLLFSYSSHTAAWIRWLGRAIAPLPQQWRQALLAQAAAGAEGARALTDARSFIHVLGISVVKWMLVAGCNMASLLALGIDVPPAAALLVLACTVLALMLPSAPGYVGSIQIAYVFALTPFGVAPTAAVAASLFFHVFAYGFVVVAGLLYVHRSGYRLADLSAEVRRQ